MLKIDSERRAYLFAFICLALRCVNLFEVLSLLPSQSRSSCFLYLCPAANVKKGEIVSTNPTRFCSGCHVQNIFLFFLLNRGGPYKIHGCRPTQGFVATCFLLSIGFLSFFFSYCMRRARE